MSSEQESLPEMTTVELVRIDVTTTSKHAERVLRGAVDALKRTLAQLQGAQAADISRENFGAATYTNNHIAKALTAAFEAKQRLETFTTQGETKNED